MAAHQSRRFHGKPLLQPDYDFRDVPWCAKNLAGSTVSVVTERQHLVDSIAELTLLCNEATKRKKPDAANAAPSTKKTTKPLSIEYIFDRIDTDDPLWGLMVRTDEVTSFKGRASNLKASPRWKRGMLQGFITFTTFTNWQSTFRFDSLHEMAFGQDEDALEDQMNAGLRKYDEDGSLAEELEALVKGGNPHLEGIVYPRIAEISLFGGLGCGKQLLRLLVEHLETVKATARANYDYILLQATENSIPFYEAMGFTRVGCVQGKAPSPDQYASGPVEEYQTKKNGETPSTIAKEFGVDLWDLVFLNKPLYPELTQRSWLKAGTTMFVPKAPEASALSAAEIASQKWYVAEENETPRSIAKKFNVNFSELLEANRKRHPDLVGHSKLMEGTRVQISCFHHDEEDTIAYSHWTFPEADNENEEPSYMMAMKLNRRKGNDAKLRPVAESLAVPVQPYCPQATGAKDLLLQPQPVQAQAAPLAPVFTKKKKQAKEPKKPKRPASSYMHFTKELRASMKDEFQGMSLTEINTFITDKWKALSEKEKAPYQALFEESREEYYAAMEVYEAEMKHFQRERESPQDSPRAGQVDDTLLEKVVKLKSTDGISGASKFEYFYVLTFIPDLQWVHLIPMRKAGVFGSEHPDGKGRPIWMLADEGKEIDTIASMCEVVTALTLNNSEDADDEQWDVYDNGETPPRLPVFSPKRAKASLSDLDDLPDLPVRPKKPATSFAFFCGEAHATMKKELGGKPVGERSLILSKKWKRLSEEAKQPYKDRQAKAQAKYAKALQKYKGELAKFQRENPDIDVSSLAVKTPGKKTKSRAVSESAKAGMSTGKKKRGRPRKHTLPNYDEGDVTPTPKPSRKRPLPDSEGDGTTSPKRKRGRSRKSPPAVDTSNMEVKVHRVKKDPVALENFLEKQKGGRVRAAGDDTPPFEAREEDINLSILSIHYKEVMWRYFNKLGKTRESRQEQAACDEAFAELKEKLGSEGRFYKRGTEIDLVLDDKKARAKIAQDIVKRLSTYDRWNGKTVELPPPKPPTAKPQPSKKRPPTVKPQSAKKRPPPARTVSQDTPAARGVSSPPKGCIALSFLDNEYKMFMMARYKKLGKLVYGQGGDEEESREVFELLKQRLGKGGKFLKKGRYDNNFYDVDDDEALKKIFRDLKRRNDYLIGTKKNEYLIGTKKAKEVQERAEVAQEEVKEEGCKVCQQDTDHSNILLCEGCNDEYHTYCLNPPLQSVPEGDFFCDTCKPLYPDRSSSIVLSLLDDEYKNLMYAHYRRLGKLTRGKPGDEEASREILASLKEGRGKGAKLLKKGRFDSKLYEVDEEEALRKILADLKSRNKIANRWLPSSSIASSPRLTPSRSGSSGAEVSAASAAVAEAKPRATPSRYPQRGCPAEHDGSITDELGLKPKAKSANSTRPLAPIFLKNYGKKKKRATPAAEAAPAAAEEPEITPSKRYPSRRQTSDDDSHVVSDDANCAYGTKTT